MNKVSGRAAAELRKMLLFNILLVAFMNTAEGLLKLKSCIALAADTTTIGAGWPGGGAVPAGAGGALAATVRSTGAPIVQCMDQKILKKYVLASPQRRPSIKIAETYP